MAPQMLLMIHFENVRFVLMEVLEETLSGNLTGGLWGLCLLHLSPHSVQCV